MGISDQALRNAVAIVAVLNLGYFGVEFVVALNIGSVSLFADSVDFLEDAAANALIFIALGWIAAWRATAGKALSIVLIVPAIAFVWTLLNKLAYPTPPEAFSLGVTGAGALAVNLSCAFLLARFRQGTGSLAKAAFLSARNDAFANVGIVGAGLVTLYWWRSIWPDVIVGVAVAAMNVDAARSVWKAALVERDEFQIQP